MKLKIVEELSPSQVNELIDYSNSDQLIKQTTTDNIRFRDENTYKEWLTKKRKIYALVDEKENLQGIAWFGEKKFPENISIPEINKSDYKLTFAIRIYKELRGKGYAVNFMKEAYERYIKSENYKNNSKKGFWLLVNPDNIPAIKTYKKFGFEEIETVNVAGRKIMIFN
jgi:GNAT superfamily N-acetyltransferase